ncbi:AMP-binding protein [Marinobacterium sp. AK62]|uniref:Long-chain-fatty-acid--CoA ligase n=1 Tax=Marinobacterium alkalitolerans TaxID=1542925 RepID=A0ABS3ZDT5_9GAMM|nr:AMP-binding protein [Marinobacterium alkalitolerans]MBP0049485.1 AMP-binding protein [Marinobacterium alkalitolerans]
MAQPPSEYLSLSGLLNDLARSYDEKPACGHLGASISFADLERLSRRFAAWVQHDTDLKPGDRIAIQLPNIMQYPVVLFGARRAGLVVVNTSPLSCDDELIRQLRDSEARMLVTTNYLARETRRRLEHTPVEYLVTTQIADLHPAPGRWAINLALRVRLQGFRALMPQKWRSPQVLHWRFEAVMQRGSRLIWQPPDVETANPLALLQYTGGTTGPSKGAMLTEQALLANLGQLRSRIDPFCSEGQERLLQPLPLYHIYAFMLTLVLLSRGAYVELVPDPRRMRALVKTWDRLQPTVLAGINPLFIHLCQQPEFQRLDFASLKLTISGGMALTRSVAERWYQVTGHQICEGYGLTECSPVVSVNRPDKVRLGSVGEPLPDTAVMITDEQGRELPRGETGRILVRGPQLMQGYWRQAEETRAVMQSGFLDTGDIGLIDAAGHLKIIDRRKEIINVSGFKVYPSELEDVIACHPDILECAAIGLPDSATGEQIKLYVVPATNQLTIKQVRDYCRERLTAYKVPKSVEFCRSLPRTAIGKVCRRRLRERASVARTLH